MNNRVCKQLFFNFGENKKYPPQKRFLWTSLVAQTSAYNGGNPGSIPESGRSPGEGNGNSLQYSCLENPMD